MEEQNNTNIFFPTVAVLVVTSIHVYTVFSALEGSGPIPCLIRLLSWVISIALLVIITTKIIKEKFSPNSCLWILALFLNIFLPYPAGIVYLKIRANMLNDVVEKNKPLIAAIDRYHAYKGEYPEKLKDLIPEYISVIPETDISKKSDCEYSRIEEGGYKIVITFCGKYLWHDMLIYRSDQKYKPITPEDKNRWFDGRYYLQFDWL